MPYPSLPGYNALAAGAFIPAPDIKHANQHNCDLIYSISSVLWHVNVMNGRLNVMNGISREHSGLIWSFADGESGGTAFSDG